MLNFGCLTENILLVTFPVLGTSLGRDMWQAAAQNAALPATVEVRPADSECVRAYKQLVVAMTSYHPHDRPTMDQAEITLIHKTCSLWCTSTVCH